MNSSVRPATSEELDFLSAQKNSQFRETFLRLCQNRAAVAGMIFLIFLILMFSVESKLVFLVLWICTLIGVSIYLVWLEYQHERMQKQLKLQGFSDGDLLAALKEERA